MSRITNERSVSLVIRWLDASRLFDILRGSIKCDDFTQLVAVLDLLLLLDEELGNPDKASSMGIDLARFAIRLHRFKCRFTTPTSGGWADALVNFSFVNDPHKHVVELQLQVRCACSRALPLLAPLTLRYSRHHPAARDAAGHSQGGRGARGVRRLPLGFRAARGDWQGAA